MIPPFSGGCLCGATRYRCTAPPLWQGHCHCASCRRATASALASFFGMADGAWEWTGAAPQEYLSSPDTWRSFCQRCGTPMSFHSARFPGERHFYAATLDTPEAYAPTEHFHRDQALSWLHLADGLPNR